MNQKLKVVVDASLIFKSMMVEPYSAEVVAKLAEWQQQNTSLLAPSLLAFEVTNALHKRVFRGQLAPVDVGPILADFFSIGIVLGDDQAIHTRAAELASQFARPSAYDAHYLALAEREGCDFWTADERLWNAVKGELPWVRWIGESRP